MEFPQRHILQQALAHHQAGRLPQAEALYKQILLAEPGNPYALYYLGMLAQQMGKSKIAAELIRQAVRFRPDYVEAHINLGVILTALNKFDEAVLCYQRALALKPDSAEVYYNLANTLNDQDKLAEAVISYRRALALRPEFVEAHNNLGNAFLAQGELEEAVASFRQALSLKPDTAVVHNNLGNAFLAQGELEEAVASFRQALSLKPDFIEVHSNLLLCLNYLPNISQKEIYEKSLQWDQLVKRLVNQNFAYPKNKKIKQKLKIGYVSSDFKDHSVAYFIEPVLRSHNRENVEIYCYANVKKTDGLTKLLQEKSDHWYSISGKHDIKVVERIQRDKIDILVDLGGHTRENRLLVFACKPAPIQVTWLGYPNTTGLGAIDYRFTDTIADPPGEADSLHSEKLFRLEHGFLCYQPEASAPEVAPPPCLKRGHVTFGSFNNIIKTTPQVIKCWANILKRVPESHLVLKCRGLSDKKIRTKYLQLFGEEGISADRIELFGMLPKKEDHLALYNMVDIGLDTFPYNGTTTSCEALWMGLPIVTMCGDRHSTRVGASIMHHIGLNEMIAYSTDEYISLSVLLAQDHHRLRALRDSLRQKMQASELMNAKLFAETLEKAYLQMWREWCAEAP